MTLRPGSRRRPGSPRAPCPGSRAGQRKPSLELLLPTGPSAPPRQSQTLALGYVASRIVESTVIVLGVISLLSVVTLRRDLGGARADADTLTVVGQWLVAVHDPSTPSGRGPAHPRLRHRQPVERGGRGLVAGPGDGAVAAWNRAVTLRLGTCSGMQRARSFG